MRIRSNLREPWSTVIAAALRLGRRSSRIAVNERTANRRSSTIRNPTSIPCGPSGPTTVLLRLGAPADAFDDLEIELESIRAYALQQPDSPF